ncbi:hypothetical protein [Xenorhabdus sp. KK7.4]|uniref:hypothetical protein n=1 Tax=Xenorhabdus sp. KK7.4 TaxID=1851572 RepID=UPI000C0506F0|nr:hypothetical protein [Xenorhabdus sp. KK7.4]PHM58575.1 hypothetical protein Xekk_01150 [Xenorhabdus sp. KK7.4]
MKRPFSIWVMLVLLLIMSLDHLVGILTLLIPFSQIIAKYGLLSDEARTILVYFLIRVIIWVVLSYGFWMTVSPKKNAKKFLIFAWIILILVFIFRNYEAFAGTNDKYLKYENPAEQGGAMIAFMIQFILYLGVLCNLIFSKTVANYLKVKAGKASTQKIDTSNEVINKS